jgi:prepilin-type N-terminal cleavage/methylation domain-containing protein
MKMKNKALFRKKQERNGFTLIEMLVVISIIGVLAGLTLTGFSVARKYSRDTERKSDLAQYKTAIEAFATNNNAIYPGSTSCNGGSCNGDSDTPSGLFDENISAIIPDYLPERIDDPKEDDDNYFYVYQADNDGMHYVLWGKLETGGWWELCSDGRTGLIRGDEPTDEVCDL